MKKIFILFILSISCIFCVDVSTIYENTSPGVVEINSVNSNNEIISSATGFIIKSSGIIVTNLHVIQGAHIINIKLFDGRDFFVNDIIEINIEKDIAILKINAKGLPTIKLADSKKTKIGEAVYAIGNPIGEKRTITNGIISGKKTINDDFDILQFNAQITFGSSGGVLLNKNGAAIGITSGGTSPKWGLELNYAIPIHYCQSVINNNFKPTMSIDEFRAIFSKSTNYSTETSKGMKIFYYSTLVISFLVWIAWGLMPPV